MSNNIELFSSEWWEIRRTQAIFIHSLYYQLEGKDSEGAKYYYELYEWIKNRIAKKKNET